jgi:3-oxoacyl-[acyl-carrier protein] reductase
MTPDVIKLDLDGRGYIVGGASRGIGRAIAAELVANGAHVLLVARSEDALAGVAAELGERAHPLAADVAAPDAAARIAAAAREQLPALDGVLVNHGGPPAGDALDLTDEQWRESFELVIGGPLRLLREIVPDMRDGGSILFITSVSMRQPIVGLDTSNVLRPGVAGLVKTLSRQLGPKLRVNAIAPGRIDTDRIRELDAQRAEAAGKDVEEVTWAAASAIPLGRAGEPEELARVAAFLLSGAASYVSGVSMQVDGGMTTALP